MGIHVMILFGSCGKDDAVHFEELIYAISSSVVSQKFVALVAKSNRRSFYSVWPKNGQTPLKMTVQLSCELQTQDRTSDSGH